MEDTMAANASETVENLTRLAILISDAAQNKGGAAADWKTFLTSQDFANIANNVNKLIEGVKKDDVEETIQEISKKQKALLGDKNLAELPTDKLLQYGELGNVKVVLAGNQVADKLNADF